MQIREYEPATDADACRALHVQLVEHHREIYNDPTIGGDDPGDGFDDYLATPTRVITWVAVDADTVVGMSGLLVDSAEATIEPVVVDRRCRREGVGRALVETAIADARRRGVADVNLKPVARNAGAIRAFHSLGFRTIGHVPLFMDLGLEPSAWSEGPELHGRRFDC